MISPKWKGRCRGIWGRWRSGSGCIRFLMGRRRMILRWMGRLKGESMPLFLRKVEEEVILTDSGLGSPWIWSNTITVVGKASNLNHPCTRKLQCEFWGRHSLSPSSPGWLISSLNRDDIGLRENTLAGQLYHEQKEDLHHIHIDKGLVERYYFLSPDWPLNASCPGRIMEAWWTPS